MNAEDFIADVADRSVIWFKNETEDAKVRIYNDDCAVITATLHSHLSFYYAAGHASRLPAPTRT